MTAHSQFVAPSSAGAQPSVHGGGAVAALLAAATGGLLAARRLRRLRFARRLLFRRPHEKRGMSLMLFLFLVLLGVPLVIAGILLLCGVPALTAILIGIGGLIVLLAALLLGLYVSGEKADAEA